MRPPCGLLLLLQDNSPGPEVRPQPRAAWRLWEPQWLSVGTVPLSETPHGRLRTQFIEHLLGLRLGLLGFSIQLL